MLPIWCDRVIWAKRRVTFFPSAHHLLYIKSAWLGWQGQGHNFSGKWQANGKKVINIIKYKPDIYQGQLFHHKSLRLFGAFQLRPHRTSCLLTKEAGKGRKIKCLYVCGGVWGVGEEMADEKRKTRGDLPVVSGVNWAPNSLWPIVGLRVQKGRSYKVPGSGWVLQGCDPGNASRLGPHTFPSRPPIRI